MHGAWTLINRLEFYSPRRTLIEGGADTHSYQKNRFYNDEPGPCFIYLFIYFD
jgi:hypothetical protein